MILSELTWTWFSICCQYSLKIRSNLSVTLEKKKPLADESHFTCCKLYTLLVFRRKDLCEAKPGYSVGNFDQTTMLKWCVTDTTLCFFWGGGAKRSVLHFTLKQSMHCSHYTTLYPPPPPTPALKAQHSENKASCHFSVVGWSRWKDLLPRGQHLVLFVFCCFILFSPMNFRLEFSSISSGGV